MSNDSSLVKLLSSMLDRIAALERDKQLLLDHLGLEFVDEFDQHVLIGAHTTEDI